MLRKDKFDEREEDFYEALYTQSQAQFATYVQSGTVVNNYAHIFDLLIRLRQVQGFVAYLEIFPSNCPHSHLYPAVVYAHPVYAHI